MEGEPQGKSTTTLRKGAGFFLSREGSLIDFYQVHIYKQNKIHMCGWLKFYRGKVALSYSQNVVGLVIKEEG